MTLNEEIGYNIKQRRLLMGLTQQELGEKLNIGDDFNKGQVNISQYENGKRAVPHDILMDLTEIFHCDIEELYTNNVDRDIKIPYGETVIIKDFHYQPMLCLTKWEYEYNLRKPHTYKYYRRFSYYITEENTIQNNELLYKDMLYSFSNFLNYGEVDFIHFLLCNRLI